MLTLYHNPRCSKSREGRALLEASGQPFETILYLDNPPDEKQLRALIDKLGIAPIDLVRKNETIWKSEYKGKNLTDDQVIAALLKHPKLMERPVVVSGNRAVIGRPPENIATLLRA